MSKFGLNIQSTAEKHKSNTVCYRLKASALGMSIIISLLIALVSGFFVMRTHLSQMSELRYNLKSEMLSNAESGIALLMGNPDIVVPGDSSELSLFGGMKDSVTLYRQPWGLYELIRSKAHFQENNYEISAMVGNKVLPSEKRTGLYLCDLDHQIGICGKTLLYGLNFLPDDGLKRTYIEGQNYSEKRLVQGTEKRSDNFLPEYNKSLIDALRLDLNSFSYTGAEIIDFFAMEVDSLHRSFDEIPLVLYSQGNIILEQKQFSGHIIVRSASHILVNASSQLDNVVLIAPVVEIEPGFDGNIQCIASKRISVGDESSLQFPSSLVLLTDQRNSTEIGEISIGERMSMEGTIAAIPSENGKVCPVKVTTGKEFSLQGEIYVNGDLDLKGEVHGSVWCRKTVLKTPSAMYENQLLNIAIRPDLLENDYGVSALMSSHKRTIMAWL